MNANNVLHVNRAEETTSYRRAVSEIIASIIAEHEVNLIQIAEKIDVSLGTISNAFNQKADLSPTYLKRLGLKFGCEILDPFVRDLNARVIPLEADETADALPSTAAAVHRLAIARSPASPGGERITHQELLEIEPEIDAAIRALTALKVRCSTVRAA